MRVIHWYRRTALVNGAALAVVLATTGSAAAATVGAEAAPLMSVAADSMPLTALKSSLLPGGDVSTTWQANGALVRAAGAPGSQVSFSQPSPTSMTAWVDAPASAVSDAKQYAAAGRSVYWDALGAGMSEAEAQHMASEMGGSIPGVAPAASTNIFNSACATIAGGTDGGIQGRACLVQTFLQQKPGQWYIENKIQSSAASTKHGIQPLTQEKAWYCYCANGFTYDRVAWQPARAYGVSGVPISLSASFAGFSVSVSLTVFPESVGPVTPSGISQPAFGSIWKGQNAATWDQANSVAIIHNGPGSPSNARVNLTLVWVTL
jgi:hypothetical protein